MDAKTKYVTSNVKSRAIFTSFFGKSSDELSIKEQVEKCKDYINSFPVIPLSAEPLIYQSGYSGKVMESPEFLRLAKDVRDGKINRLYVCGLRYLCSTLEEFCEIMDFLRENEVSFVSIEEDFCTAAPEAKKVLRIVSSFSSSAKEAVSSRARDNYLSKALLGGWPGGPAPYGFTIARKRVSGKEIAILKMDPKIEKIIKRVFEEYAKPDVSLSSLARTLSREGVPCAQRATWDSVSLSRILHNPAYVNADTSVKEYYEKLGVNILSPDDAFDGKHNILLFGKREANSRKYTSVDNHKLVVMLSCGMVSSELFLACQEKLSKNTQLGNAGKGSHTWLSGLLKCAKCGYSVSVMKEKSGHRRLHCSGRYNNSCCDASIRLSLSDMETAIATLLKCKEPNFDSLSFDEKKSVVFKYIDRVNISESEYSIIWKELFTL